MVTFPVLVKQSDHVVYEPVPQGGTHNKTAQNKKYVFLLHFFLEMLRAYAIVVSSFENTNDVRGPHLIHQMIPIGHCLEVSPSSMPHLLNWCNMLYAIL